MEVLKYKYCFIFKLHFIKAERDGGVLILSFSLQMPAPVRDWECNRQLGWGWQSPVPSCHPLPPTVCRSRTQEARALE